MAESAKVHPEEENEEKNNHPFRHLTEWSKWLIGINFASATGCLVVLKTSAENASPNLLLGLQGAILTFCLSVICAIFLIFFASISAVETNKEIEKNVKVFTWLGYFQIFFFVVALGFLNYWVYIKANPKVNDCVAKCQSLKETASSADKK